MTFELLTIVIGIIFSAMLTAVSFDYIPSSFWQLPFSIVVVGVFAVFVAWFMVFNALVNIVKR